MVTLIQSSTFVISQLQLLIFNTRIEISEISGIISFQNAASSTEYMPAYDLQLVSEYASFAV